MKTIVLECIYEALESLALELENDELATPTPATKIYGGGGPLDSLALVSLIADLEAILQERLQNSLVLADDKTMSARTSPFREVGTLCDYILSLLDSKDGHAKG